MNTPIFDLVVTDRIIEMAWEDRTPFDVIKIQFGIGEQQVIELMRKEIKPSSFKMWRKRVQGRKTKHGSLSGRFKCDRQRQISANKISKRN
ncbi:TIGR03643 family protein [Mucilaginibacter flavidus]|uniref:TIGR03643 family protein n=1 Tax=Mucilaginibacter flavidus TaxID=2949309 RepID=UPI0020939818|nr:TIGR03643 family protein [Mucilaginibacter flavidus]MCO5951094.1 TIGR03643 family protein [Mucilaginibacter flavidus]